MYSTMENEKVMRGPATMRDAITRADGWRGLVSMGETLAFALQRRLQRAAIARQLMALDDRMLADIGLERWQIAEVADSAVGGERQRAAAPLSQAVRRFVSDRLVAPFRRAYQRRAAYRELSALDDHMLKDIGLTRGEIPAVVRALSEQESRRQAPVHAGEGHDVLRSIRQWNRSRWAAKALNALDDRMLSDIGLVRGDVDEVAEELAVRSLRKPAANRNVTSQAA